MTNANIFKIGNSFTMPANLSHTLFDGDMFPSEIQMLDFTIKGHLSYEDRVEDRNGEIEFFDVLVLVLEFEVCDQTHTIEVDASQVWAVITFSDTFHRGKPRRGLDGGEQPPQYRECISITHLKGEWDLYQSHIDAMAEMAQYRLCDNHGDHRYWL